MEYNGAVDKKWKKKLYLRSMKGFSIFFVMFLLSCNYVGTFSFVDGVESANDFSADSERLKNNRDAHILQTTWVINYSGVRYAEFNDSYKGDSSTKCSDFHKLSNKSEICHFVKTTDDCKIDEGFINYTLFVFCTLQVVPLALIIVFLWWLFLFVGLAVTAEDFFCPSLEVISKTLHLSHNVAGVTFLAFGNGAGDIFSAIAAVGSAKNGDASLAIGALLGAGVFITTVIVGTISITHPFDAMQRPFFRDVIFFLGAVFWLFYILWDKEITKFESMGFILLYVFYVIVVVIGRYIYQRTRDRSIQESNTPELNEQSIQNGDDDLFNSGYAGSQKYNVIPSSRVPDERTPLLENAVVENYSFRQTTEDMTVFKQFMLAVNPIDTDRWPAMRIHSKIFEIFKSPILIILKLTVPVMDYKNEDKHNWNRILNSLHCLTGPLVVSMATKIGFQTVGSGFPVLGLVVILGSVVGVLVFYLTKQDEKPVFHAAFGYLGFFVAFIWIYSIANEIVNILQTFGAVFNISGAILGLTLLAWGNSLGDFISDFTVARQGYPRMGISACYGGPLFNILLGIGIPFTIKCIKHGGSYKLNITLEEFVIFVFLVISLVTSLIVVPLSKFHMSRPFGIYLMIFYVVFLVTVILTESGTIHGKID